MSLLADVAVGAAGGVGQGLVDHSKEMYKSRYAEAREAAEEKRQKALEELRNSHKVGQLGIANKSAVSLLEKEQTHDAEQRGLDRASEEKRAGMRTEKKGKSDREIYLDTQKEINTLYTSLKDIPAESPAAQTISARIKKLEAWAETIGKEPEKPEDAEARKIKHYSSVAVGSEEYKELQAAVLQGKGEIPKKYEEAWKYIQAHNTDVANEITKYSVDKFGSKPVIAGAKTEETENPPPPPAKTETKKKRAVGEWRDEDGKIQLLSPFEWDYSKDQEITPEMIEKGRQQKTYGNTALPDPEPKPKENTKPGEGKGRNNTPDFSKVKVSDETVAQMGQELSSKTEDKNELKETLQMIAETNQQLAQRIAKSLGISLREESKGIAGLLSGGMTSF